MPMEVLGPTLSIEGLHDEGVQNNNNGKGSQSNEVRQNCIEVKNNGTVVIGLFNLQITLERMLYPILARSVSGSRGDPPPASANLLQKLNESITELVDEITDISMDDLQYVMSGDSDGPRLHCLPPPDAILLVQIGIHKRRPAHEIFRAASFYMIHMALLRYVLISRHDGNQKEMTHKDCIVQQVKEAVSGSIQSLFHSISTESSPPKLPDSLNAKLENIAHHAWVLQDCLLKEGYKVFLNLAEDQFSADHMESIKDVGNRRRCEVFYTVDLGLAKVDVKGVIEKIVKKQRVMCL